MSQIGIARGIVLGIFLTKLNEYLPFFSLIICVAILAKYNDNDFNVLVKSVSLKILREIHYQIMTREIAFHPKGKYIFAPIDNIVCAFISMIRDKEEAKQV
jgi:hypothetical protein